MSVEPCSAIIGGLSLTSRRWIMTRDWEDSGDWPPSLATTVMLYSLRVSKSREPLTVTEPVIRKNILLHWVQSELLENYREIEVICYSTDSYRM